MDVHIRRLREKIETTQVILNMCIQNGSRLLFSTDKINFDEGIRREGKNKIYFFKSLRFRIMVILVVIGIVPSFIVKNVVVNSYETRAVSIREVNLKISVIFWEIS